MQLIELCYDNFSSVNLDCSRPVEPSTFDFNENFDFTTHLSYKRENFFGRSWFFRELDDIFENADAPVGVLVTGDPGSGKSALMSQLIFFILFQLRNLRQHYWISYLCLCRKRKTEWCPLCS